MSERIPEEVTEGVRNGCSYIFDRDGWHAVPAVPAKPELTPLNAIRRLDGLYGDTATEYANEAITVLWVHHMRENGRLK